MPIIRIDYDDKIVSESDLIELSKALNKILITVSQIDDCPIYPQAYKLPHKIAPIEIYVELSSHLIKDLNDFTIQVREKLSLWKKETNFVHKLNLAVIPMNWKLEFDI